MIICLTFIFSLLFTSTILVLQLDKTDSNEHSQLGPCLLGRLQHCRKIQKRKQPSKISYFVFTSALLIALKMLTLVIECILQLKNG